MYRSTFFALAIVGLSLASMAFYMQIMSMDLGRFQFSDYIVRDIALFEWWKAIGFPLLAGIAFILVSVWGIRGRRKLTSIVCNLGICLALSVLLLIAGSGWGIFSSLSMIALMVMPVRALVAGE